MNNTSFRYCLGLCHKKLIPAQKYCEICEKKRIKKYQREYRRQFRLKKKATC